MVTTATKDEPEGADAKFGYRFGIDGLVSLEEACRFLGGINRDTLNKYAAQGLIRKGKRSGLRYGRVVICKRSLEEYASSLEL